MMKRLLVIFFILIILGILPITAFAQQQSESNVKRTRVGNPATTGEGLLGVGLVIKDAYDACSSGDTHEPPASLSCLQTQLSQSGLPQAQIDAFSSNYSTRKVGSPIGRGVSCIQCLGFVGLVVSTYTEADSLRYPNPKAMSGLGSFSSGGKTFQQLARGTTPEPGDIGVHGGGTDGHIVIVKESVGNVRFKALESNGNSDCRITDTRDILIDQYGYTFFREQ